MIATEDHDFYNHPGVDVRGILRAAYTDLVKRGTGPGRLHDHGAAREERLRRLVRDRSRDGRAGLRPARAVRHREDPRGAAGDQARAGARQGQDPRALPEHRLLRARRLRDRGRGARPTSACPRASSRSWSPPRSPGVLHAPELYDPIDRPDDNRFRRDYALDQMVRYGYLDADDARAAEGEAVLRHDRGRSPPSGIARPGKPSTSSTTRAGTCSSATARPASTAAACRSRRRSTSACSGRPEHAIAHGAAGRAQRPRRRARVDRPEHGRDPRDGRAAATGRRTR